MVVVGGGIIVVLSGVASALAIALLLRHALRLGLVQAPNSRSSHIRPTPTGGGIGIVLGSTIAGAVAVAANGSWHLAALLLGSLLIAGLGLWDDLRPLPAAARLPVQVVVVALTVVFAVQLPALQAALGLGALAPFLSVLLVLGLVYWVNLFNFMDGIDGLAGGEALFLLLAPIGLALFADPAASTAAFGWPLALAAAVLGFLAFNWQPARIFMGDVGSTFLGFTIAMFALLEIAAGTLSGWQALILAACFATDATLTLLRRAARGETILTAHRRHAYQRLARRLGSHQHVTIAVLVVDLVWLLPLAFAAQHVPDQAPLLALLAYTPIAIFALIAGAGQPEHA